MLLFSCRACELPSSLFAITEMKRNYKLMKLNFACGLGIKNTELQGSSDHSFRSSITCWQIQTLLPAASISTLKTDPQRSWCSQTESWPLPSSQLLEWWKVVTAVVKCLSGPWVTAVALCSGSQLSQWWSTNGPPSWRQQNRQLPWKASLEVRSRGQCCRLEPASPAFHWFLYFQFHASNSSSASNTQSRSCVLKRALPDSCNANNPMRKYYCPSFAIWGNWGIGRLLACPRYYLESSRARFLTQTIYLYNLYSQGYTASPVCSLT